MLPEENKAAAQSGLKKGQIVRALDVVKAEPSVDKLLKALLGRTFVASDLATATNQIQNGHAGCDFVTLTGDLLSRHGVYTGGYLNGHGNPKGPASILGRKNQITELQNELTEVQNRVAEMSRRRGALLGEQTELQAGLQRAQTELREQEVAIATREGEFNALQNSSRLLHQKIETVIFEIQSLAAQEQEGSQKRNALAAQLAELELRERAGQGKVAGLTAELENLRQQRDTANSALTESKVALAAEEQLLASFRQQQQALEQRIRELTQALEQRRGEVSSFVGRKEQAESEIQDSRSQVEKLRHEREQVGAQTTELSGRKNLLETDISSREENLRGQRNRLTELQNQRGTIDVELAQKNMSVQNLRERIQQKYHANLDDVRSECITITFADEGPAKVHVMTPEEMAASGAATDWNAVAQQIESLQKRLDEIGPVNLVAIEEYEETEQRYQFLTKQHDDLVSAKAQLLEVINRINVQTRQMFVETFGKIRENFRSHVRRGFRRRQSGFDFIRRKRRAGKRHRNRRPPARQTAPEHLAAVRRRADHDRRRAALFHLPGPAQPILRAGRVGRAARRGEHQPLRPRPAALHRALAIRHHHPQQAHHRHGRRALRRDDAGTRREQDRQREIPQGGRRTGAGRKFGAGDGISGRAGSPLPAARIFQDGAHGVAHPTSFTTNNAQCRSRCVPRQA